MMGNPWSLKKSPDQWPVTDEKLGLFHKWIFLTPTYNWSPILKKIPLETSDPS